MKKTKKLAAILLAGIVLQQTVHAQPNAVGTNQTASLVISNQVNDAMVSNVSKMSTGGDQTVTTTSNATTTSTTVSNQSSSVTTISNAPASPDASNSPAPVAGSNEPPSATAGNEVSAAGNTNPPAEAVDTNAQAAAATGTNAPAAALLPIQFQDVPITTAIESLARLAGINYMLDPKIGYGQPDAQGHINTEPTLSIRWESVTAEQALLALLDNYGLQLVEDSKTKIAKIHDQGSQRTSAVDHPRHPA